MLIFLNALIVSKVSVASDMELKIKQSVASHLELINFQSCLHGIDGLNKNFQIILSKMTLLEKCTLDLMNDVEKTRICYQDIIQIRSELTNLKNLGQSNLSQDCDSSDIRPTELSEKINNAIATVSSIEKLIYRNFKVIFINEINKNRLAISIELSKTVESMECLIELGKTASAVNVNSTKALSAKIKNDYHEMKRSIIILSSLKTKMDLLLNKCQIPPQQDVISAFKSIKQYERIFEETDLKMMLEKACKKILPLSPSQEIISSCENYNISDYFFSTLSELLKKKRE